MIPRSHLFGLILFPVLLVAANGCAVSGPPFAPLKAGPGRSVVYAYRPYAFTGAAIGLPVEVVETKAMVTLGPGGYHPFEVSGGPVTLQSKTEGTSIAQIDAGPGKAYYVRVSIAIGVWAGRGKLEVVPAETGEKEIQACKLQE